MSSSKEIQILRNWEFAKDADSECEYVFGNRQIWGEVSDRLFETSNIKYKLPLKDAFLVVTVNDGLYKLPYCSSYRVS